MSFRRNQKLKFALTGIAVLNRVRDASKARPSPAGSSPIRSSAGASGLLASPSSSSRVPSRARSWVRPGASVWAGMPVYGGGTRRTVSALRAGGGTTRTATSRIDVESSPPDTLKWNG